jgi:hypothetical protein
MRRSLRRITAFAGSFALILPALAAPPKPANKKTDAAIQAKQMAEIPQSRAAVRFEPGNRRDPFQSLISLRKQQENVDEEAPRGLPPPGIAGMYIAQVKLQGIASQPDKRTAVFRGSDNRAYFLLEGDRLFDGFVKKIEPDSVLLIRESKFRSGKVLNQEVMKRLRTP